jgi:serine/threonine-protein kinase
MNRIGNYRVDHELGSNGTSVFYEATHLVLPRRALIKVTHAAIGWLKAFQVQSLREPCILEALQHPGIVRVYESGVLADRRPWFACELVEGVPLTSVLGHGPRPSHVVLELVRDLAAVLAHAHRRGIVHGGLRPDRVVLTPTGRGFPLCIHDWSDARTHDAGCAVPHRAVPGARHYVAPEQASGDQPDARADVYALGVIGYQALTGQLPDVSGSAYVPAGKRGLDAPVELTTLIDEMMSVDPADRPTAGTACADLAFLHSVMPDPALALRRPARWTPSWAYAPIEDSDDVAVKPARS